MSTLKSATKQLLKCSENNCKLSKEHSALMNDLQKAINAKNSKAVMNLMQKVTANEKKYTMNENQIKCQLTKCQKEYIKLVKLKQNESMKRLKKVTNYSPCRKI